MAPPNSLRTLRRAAGAALDAVLPPQCLSCRAPVDRQRPLCAACWSEIDFITDALCEICGTPFEFDAGDNALCAACIAEPAVCARGRAPLLADAAASAGVSVMPDLLVRTKPTPSQAGRNWRARADNIRGSFALRPGRAQRIAGRRVILADDVLTSGATVAACAKVLLRGGAAAVDVLTLAQVVRPVPVGD